ncbi:MAG: zinc-ribbon and DUF3426 domain-containing protein [Burkholderiales bacterium]
MKLFTTCPQCRRSFHITQEQLDARQGQVRCGRCQQVFDARKSLQDADAPVPGPEAEALEITQEIVEEITIAALPGEVAVAPAEPHLPTPTPLPEAEETGPAPDKPEARDAAPEEESPPHPFPAMPPESERTAAFEQTVVLAEPLVPEPAAPASVPSDVFVPEPAPAIPKPRRRWPWIVGIVVLLLLLAVQALYFYRTEIAVRYPAAKPLLEQACLALQCRIGLPREIDKLGIEGSDLQADPARSALLTLAATLRNRSPFPQTYPLLELSLTDKDDHVIAKRILAPTDYLPPNRPVEAGMPGNGELAITLHFELSDLNAVGYRLYLFYPQS